MWNYIYTPLYRRDIKTLKRMFPEKINIGFGDTETAKGKPFLMTFYDKTHPGTDRFKTSVNKILDEFIFWCDRFAQKGVTNILACHNLLYDLSAVLSAYPQFFLKDKIHFEYQLNHIHCTVEINTKKICFGQVKFSDKRMVKLIDTYAFTFSSLKSACESYQLKFNKLKPPKLIGEKKYTSPKFYKYSDMDVISGYELLDKIMDIHREYDIEPCVSVPQLSARIFRKKFLRPEDLIEYPPTKQHDIIAQRAYHGGKSGTYCKTVLDYSGPTTALDIVSAYPMAMFQMPSMLKGQGRYIDVKNIKDYEPNGIYAVWGNIKKTRYPLFWDEDFQPVFGRQMVYTTGHELQRGIVNDLISISKIIGYKWVDEIENCYKPLAEFIKFFYDIKKNAKDKVQKTISKIILNSLYGKFFSKIEEEELTPQGEKVKVVRATGLFNPFIASLITGYTRGQIFDYELKYKAIHTATDGLIVPGKIDLGKKDKLGALETEAFFERLFIFRTKVYCGFKDHPLKFKYDEKEKPVNFKEAHHGFNGDIEMLFKLFKKKKTNYEYRHMTKMREFMKAKKVKKIPLYMQTWNKEINIDFKEIYKEIKYL